MSTAVICAILVVICIFSIKSYAKKLTQGCCGGGVDPERPIKPRDRNISHYSHCYTIIIEGMSCKNCAVRIENAFNKTEGLYAAADLKRKTARLYSKERLDPEDIAGRIAKAGYKAADIRESRV